ncbi:MAG: glutamine-hydrolyzing GMP synthase, partial [Propionibacteriaceae bacterium]|nr:glutamine-hydrolyzing GMP synthase [Propionibacteriaceae bacterium]
REPVWMSHGDRVVELPEGFRAVATSANAPFAAIADDARRFYGIQFHAEVAHTPGGAALLRRFTHGICGCRGDWTMAAFREEAVDRIRRQVGDGRVLMALSGGVDSAVAALLLFEAIGDRLTCVFVDHGLLRADEATQVVELFRGHYNIPLVPVDASALFLGRLAGVTDPEAKRKIIGAAFIEVFEAEAAKLGGADFLGQGTLYPDVIESISAIGGPSVTIKSHHNVGGLPERMNMALVEPLRELFKDEVREVGRELGLPEKIVGRHPFPGPGLGIRIVGAVDAERLRILRAADLIVRQETTAAGLDGEIWQFPVVLLADVRSVGVQGDGRTYGHPIVLRPVTSEDAMTADWGRLPYDVLERISTRITNEVPEVNRVVLDITSKPPGTIEWE